MRWPGRIFCCLLAAGLPLALRWSSPLPQMLVQPVLLLLCAILSARRERWCGLICTALFVAAGCAAVYRATGKEAILFTLSMLVMTGAVSAAGLILCRGWDVRRATGWWMVCCALWLALAAAHMRFQFGVTNAEELLMMLLPRDWLFNQLVSMARAGMIPLELSETDMLRFALFGAVTKTDENFNQLLHAAGWRLRDALYAVLPWVTVIWCGVTGVTHALLHEGYTWRRAGYRDLPPFRAWHLPRGWGMAVGLLFWGLLMAQLFGGTVGLVGTMMAASAFVVYTVQGMALLWFGHGEDAKLTASVALLHFALPLLLCPVLFTLGGMVDQRLDLRALRPRKDDGDDRSDE